jgi:hypothetical protein
MGGQRTNATVAMEKKVMDSLAKQIIGAIGIVAFLLASWYFQRDKIDVVMTERDAMEKSLASKVAYQNCLQEHAYSGDVEACEPLEEKMKTDAEEYAKIHTETSKALNLPE